MPPTPKTEIICRPDPTEQAAMAAVAGFLAGYCDPTRRSYATDLRLFAAWCAEAGLGLFAVRRAHLELFGRWMEECGRMRSTVARRLSTLASFYRYCHQEGLIDTNPALNVRRPKLDCESRTLGLDRNELGAFLVQAGLGSPRGPCPGLASGPQRSSDLRGPGRRCRRLGLRAWAPHAQDPAKGRQACHDPPRPPNLAGHRPVHRRASNRTDLPRGQGGRMDRYAADRTVKRLARLAGIAKKISPHSLRHSFITAALDAGVPPRDVQEAASHADPRTTMR